MTREFIINELNNRGIKVEATDVVKNGVTLKGIILGEGTVKPTIYTEQYADAPENMIDTVVRYVKEILDETPQIDMNNLINWDWVKTRLRLCLQRKGIEPICKRDFLDLEQYVRVIVDKEQGATCKVNPTMLAKYGIDEEILFNVATDCTRPLVDVRDITYMIADMMDMSIDEVMEMQGGKPPMTVVTNKEASHGASAICYTDVLKGIADKYKSDLAIIPSSIHECILYPLESITDLDQITTMVREVNATEISPEEVLSDHGYIYDREENKIFASISEYAQHLNN